MLPPLAKRRCPNHQSHLLRRPRAVFCSVAGETPAPTTPAPTTPVPTPVPTTPYPTPTPTTPTETPAPTTPAPTTPAPTTPAPTGQGDMLMLPSTVPSSVVTHERHACPPNFPLSATSNEASLPILVYMYPLQIATTTTSVPATSFAAQTPCSVSMKTPGLRAAVRCLLLPMC